MPDPILRVSGKQVNVPIAPNGIATSALLAIAASLPAYAAASCDGDLSAWPTSIQYKAPATVGNSASLVLGPPTISGIGIYEDPAAISVSGNTVTIAAYWSDNCGIGLPPLPNASLIPVPELAPGIYTVNFDVIGLPTRMFTRMLIVGGSPAMHFSIPILSMAGMLSIIGGIAFVAWMRTK